MRSYAAKTKHRSWGLSDKAYEILLDEQSNACAICGQGGKLCVDHDHKTMQVRGLLCSTCNAGLGMFKDNIRLLAGAIVYLEDHSELE